MIECTFVCEIFGCPHPRVKRRRMMSRPERKVSRMLLKYGVVGDYDGAYDWVDSSKHTDPDYSIGEHEGTFPSDRYIVIEIVDSAYVDNLETWFDAELKAAENDYKRYKKLKATSAALLEVLELVANCNARGDFNGKGKVRGYTLYIKKRDYETITEAIRKAKEK